MHDGQEIGRDIKNGRGDQVSGGTSQAVRFAHVHPLPAAGTSVCWTWLVSRQLLASGTEYQPGLRCREHPAHAYRSSDQCHRSRVLKEELKRASRTSRAAKDHRATPGTTVASAASLTRETRMTSIRTSIISQTRNAWTRRNSRAKCR